MDWKYNIIDDQLPKVFAIFAMKLIFVCLLGFEKILHLSLEIPILNNSIGFWLGVTMQDRLFVVKNRELKSEIDLWRGQDNKITYFCLRWNENRQCYCVSLNKEGQRYYERGIKYCIDMATELSPGHWYSIRSNQYICRKRSQEEIAKTGEKIGTQLFVHYGKNPYLILSRILDTSARKIYLCLARHLHNTLVILKLRYKQSVNIERFKRSALHLSSVSPYLPRFIDMGSISLDNIEYEFQSFEYFPSETLDKKIPLDQKEAAVIFHQVASAIQDLHRVGLVHRNLKPEHILVDAYGQVKLVGLTLIKKEEMEIEANSCLTLAGTLTSYDHEVSLPGEIVGDFLYCPISITDFKLKDIYSILSLFIYSVQMDETLRNDFRLGITRKTSEEFTAMLPEYFNHIPGKLKELLDEVLIEKIYVSAAEIARRISSVYSYITQEIDSSDQYPMPQEIKIPKAKVAIWYSPLEELGGDFYDCINLGKNKYGFLIGDTMGHGMKACLYTHLIYPVAQLFSQQKVTPMEVLAKMDMLLYRSGRARNRSAFATAIYGLLCLDSFHSYFMFASAGHPAPILYRKPEARFLKLENTPFAGMKIGMGPNTFKTIENFIPLQAGDILFFYTDGIIEARNAGGDCYEDLLLDSICRYADLDPEDIIERLKVDIKDFSKGSSYEKDDITCIVVKILA